MKLYYIIIILFGFYGCCSLFVIDRNPYPVTIYIQGRFNIHDSAIVELDGTHLFTVDSLRTNGDADLAYSKEIMLKHGKYYLSVNFPEYGLRADTSFCHSSERFFILIACNRDSKSLHFEFTKGGFVWL